MKDNLHALKELLKLASPMAGWMILAVSLGILGFVAALMIPVGAVLTLMALLQHQSVSFLWISLALLGCALLRGMLRYGEQTCNHYIAFKLLAHIRDLIYGQLRRLGAAKLDGRKKGDLIALITSDVELLEVFYAHTISPVCIAAGCAVLFSIPAFLVHWSCGLLLLVSYGTAGIILPMIMMKRTSAPGAALRAKASGLTSLVLENVSGLKENLQYQLTENRLQAIAQQTDALVQEEARLKSSEAAITSSMQWINGFFSLAMTALAGSLAAAGIIAPEQILFLLVLQASSFGPFAALASLGAGLAQTLGAAGRVTSLLQETPRTQDVLEGVPAEEGEMSLHHADFAYDTKEPVLQDLSPSIEPGTVTAISGPSGCGKSTLLRLLMRFFDPDRGSVTLSGADLRTITTSSLRSYESFMMQDTVLFHDTIRENLRIARADATEEQMREACRRASIDDLIMSFENGYDTLVGEGGCTLSAGEKQRLGLARAFLSPSRLMLLDEPTSNLDALNEGAILKAADSFRHEKTIVLVSHKKGTLNFADRQIVLQPHAAGAGSPEEQDADEQNREEQKDRGKGR